MPETITLQYDHARTAQALFGNDLKLLKSLEEALQVKVTAREGWIRIEGEKEAIAAGREVFAQLDSARQAGMTIGKPEFQFALRAVQAHNGQRLSDLMQTQLHLSTRKGPIVARTENQAIYVRAIERHDIVFGVGPAGTGKTYLAAAMAIDALRKEKVSRIILTRPAVEAGEALGFLPGDLTEKVFPYLRPLYDALHDMLEPEEVQRYTERGIVEIAPLAYMRGRTLGNAFVILDEAQNTTTEQMFMFLTRLGAASKCVVTGDRTQIDLPQHKRSGLIEALQALKDVPGISFCQFDERDVVRHELVASIIKAYRQHRNGDTAEGRRR